MPPAILMAPSTSKEEELEHCVTIHGEVLELLVRAAALAETVTKHACDILLSALGRERKCDVRVEGPHRADHREALGRE